MDTQQRIEAAKERLAERQSQLHQAKAAGPPCFYCEHFIRQRYGSGKGLIGPYCGHPAYTDINFTADNGKMSLSQRVRTAAARKPDGLCGPEAALFDKSSLFARVKRIFA